MWSNCDFILDITIQCIYMHMNVDTCVKTNMYVPPPDSRHCMIKSAAASTFITSSSKMTLKLKGKNYMFHKIINMY